MRNQYLDLIQFAFISLILTVSSPFLLRAQSPNEPDLKVNGVLHDPLVIRRCEDFKLTGKGDDKAWLNTPWSPLTKLDQGGSEYESKFKMLFSPNGVDVVGGEKKISATIQSGTAQVFFSYGILGLLPDVTKKW